MPQRDNSPTDRRAVHRSILAVGAVGTIPIASGPAITAEAASVAVDFKMLQAAGRITAA